MVTTSLVICIVAGFIGLWVLFYFIPVGLWFTALISGVHISLLQLILMRWRKVPPQTIVRAMIEAHKAGLQGIKRDDLEAHYLAGGHVEAVVHALVSAEKANIDLRRRTGKLTVPCSVICGRKARINCNIHGRQNMAAGSAGSNADGESPKPNPTKPNKQCV